ncbi:hypothetical protein D3C87_1172510 [compost metagenome]
MSFRHFFKTTVQVTDFAVCTHDCFAVHFSHHTKCSVHCCMGRTNVQRNIFIIQHVTWRTRFVIEMNWQRCRTSLLAICFVVFAKWMAHELVMSQNFTQVRVTIKDHTKHVETFAFKPVSTLVSA